MNNSIKEELGEEDIWERAYRQAEEGNPELLFRLQDEDISLILFIGIMSVIVITLGICLWKAIRTS